MRIFIAAAAALLVSGLAWAPSQDTVSVSPKADPRARVAQSHPASQSPSAPPRALSDAPHAERVSGTYHQAVEDYPQGSRERHWIQTPRGRVMIAPALARRIITPPGQPVSIAGIRRGDTLDVGPGSPPPITLSARPQALALTDTLGEQRVAAILVKFQDDPTEPQTVAQVHDLVFNQVNNFYRASSFGQTWLAGQVFDYVVVPYNRTACTDTMLISQSADASLAARGVDLSTYRRKIYFWPRNACTWTGLALVGENPSLAWINGSFTLKAVAHELGHGFGLRHAHAQECAPLPTGDACTVLPYGDSADIMGNVRTGDFSAYAKERLLWLGDGVSPDILTAQQTGRYTIEPYAGSGVGAKAIRVPRGTDAQGRTLYFYMEHRLPVGVDSVLAGVGNLDRGLMVRTVIHGDGDSIHQLDMTPDSSSGSTADLADGALAPAAPYADPLSGVRVVVASVSSTGAVVDITHPSTTPPTCNRQAPRIEIGATPSVRAGTTATVQATLINMDDPNQSACTAVQYGLSVSPPAGWSAAVSPTTLTLSAGQRATVSVQLTSSTQSPAGNYTYTVHATSQSNPQGSGQGMVSLTQACQARPPRTVVRPRRSGDALNYSLFFDSVDSLRCSASDQATNGQPLTPANPLAPVQVYPPVQPPKVPVVAPPAPSRPNKPVRVNRVSARNFQGALR